MSALSERLDAVLAKYPTTLLHQVLRAFSANAPGPFDDDDRARLLTTTATAHDLLGGDTFVYVGKFFAENPTAYQTFSAAVALDTPTFELQKLLIQLLGGAT